MTGFSILKGVFDFLLQTKLVNLVYHSVEIIETENNRFPVYPPAPAENGDLVYVGVDDTKIMNCYVRQTGDLRTGRKDKISSSVFEYEVAVQHRVVFFNDYEERNADDLIKIFIQLAFLPGVTLKAVIVDKERLLQLETLPKNFKLDNKSFYAAIDFEINFRLTRDNCEKEISCSSIPNPYC